jgi:glycosyltransferase involved in cell wall biosynthesis
VAVIHQLVAAFSSRDAVGNHTALAREALRGAGHESEIFAEVVAPGVNVPVHRARDLPPDCDVIYQMAIGSMASEIYRRHRGHRLLNYHNITPSQFFDGWEPHVVAEIEVGRAQLAELATVTEHGIADSEFNRRELQELGYRSTCTVPVLHDVRIVPHPPATAAGAAGGGPRGTRILFVGRLVPNKAQHDLISAFAVYRSVYDPEAHLDLVGFGAAPHYVAALKGMAAASPLLRRGVHFHSSVSDAKLSALYAGASLFCCLSDHEGFGVPLVEAMAHGVPVVAFASSGVTETVGDGGLVLPKKDAAVVATAWHRILTDPDLAAELVEAGHRRVADFRIERTSAMFVSEVEGALVRARSR